MVHFNPFLLKMEKPGLPRYMLGPEMKWELRTVFPGNDFEFQHIPLHSEFKEFKQNRCCYLLMFCIPIIRRAKLEEFIPRVTSFRLVSRAVTYGSIMARSPRV